MKKTVVTLTSWQLMAERIPPRVCLMLARRGRRGLASTEIARATGKGVAWIGWIARRNHFGGVPIDVVDRFQAACGITPRNMADHLRYMARSYRVSLRPLRHLDDGEFKMRARRSIANVIFKPRVKRVKGKGNR